jgi:hypothetical protein
VLPLCINDHWVRIIFQEDHNPLRICDSFTGVIPAHQLDAFAQDVSLCLTDVTDRDAPTHDQHDTPQQPNSWDCGVYLLVSLIRMIGLSAQEIGEGDDRPQPIDGTFFRAILAEYFDPALDSVATVDAVSMPDIDHDGGGIDLKTKLLEAKAFLDRLQACEASAKLTTQLFTALGTALRKASTRLETHVRQFQILSRALAETDTFFELHRQFKYVVIDLLYSKLRAFWWSAQDTVPRSLPSQHVISPWLTHCTRVHKPF